MQCRGSFAGHEGTGQRRRTRREEEFLVRVGAIVPWAEWGRARRASPEALGDSLRDGLCVAVPGLGVCEWWDWVPPGMCLYVDLPVSPAHGVEEALTLHVLVSALCPYCCVFCQRSLFVPSAETLVRDLVDAVRAAADAVGEALAGLGYRRLALRQALRPVGPPNPNLGHDGLTSLLDVDADPLDPAIREWPQQRARGKEALVEPHVEAVTLHPPTSSRSESRSYRTARHQRKPYRLTRGRPARGWLLAG